MAHESHMSWIVIQCDRSLRKRPRKPNKPDRSRKEKTDHIAVPEKKQSLFKRKMRRDWWDGGRGCLKWMLHTGLDTPLQKLHS